MSVDRYFDRPGRNQITGLSMTDLFGPPASKPVSATPTRKTAAQLRQEATRLYNLTDVVSQLENAKAQVERAQRYVKEMQEQGDLSAEETMQIALAGGELSTSCKALSETTVDAAQKVACKFLQDGFAKISSRLV